MLYILADTTNEAHAMSTLYEAAQELKKQIEDSGNDILPSFQKVAEGIGARPETVLRLLGHHNPAALTDYMLACYIAKNEGPEVENVEQSVTVIDAYAKTNS